MNSTCLYIPNKITLNHVTKVVYHYIGIDYIQKLLMNYVCMCMCVYV